MKKLVLTALSSLSVTGATFLTTFYASIQLSSDDFAHIGYYLHLFPLVVELSLLGQNYTVLKFNKNWKLDLRKIIIGILIAITILLIFLKENQVFFVCLIISLLFFIVRISSAIQRVNEYLLISVISEKTIQIVFSVIFLLLIVDPSSIVNIETSILYVLLLITAVILFLYPRSLDIRELNFKNRTDTKYEINIYLTVCSMLAIRSLDKVIVGGSFGSHDFSKYLVLMQLYLPFPIIVGALFQYYLPIFSSSKNIVFKKKYAVVMVIFSLISVFPTSFICSIVFENIYKDKFIFNNLEFLLIVSSGFIFLLYQPLALVILSSARNKVLATLNFLNLGTCLIYFFIIFVGILVNNLCIVLLGFSVFWLLKLISGLFVVKRVEKFSWV